MLLQIGMLSSQDLHDNHIWCAFLSLHSWLEVISAMRSFLSLKLNRTHAVDIVYLLTQKEWHTQCLRMLLIAVDTYGLSVLLLLK